MHSSPATGAAGNGRRARAATTTARRRKLISRPSSRGMADPRPRGRPGRPPPGDSSPPPPPLVHELIDHLDELAHRPALLDDVTGRRVERHHAVPDPPAPLPFRIEPDDALDALA